jgi:hypothetical protein
MTFAKRLRYYILGFGMGLLVCVVLFGQRGCDWTPSNRVLKQIATSEILITDSVRCILVENKIEEDEIFKTLNGGSVIFSESETQKIPKFYVLENPAETFKIRFVVRNDTVSIIDGVPGGKQGRCKGFGSNPEHIFTMPEKTVKRLLKAQEISAADSILAKLKKYNIKDEEIYNMIESGKIDFKNSMPTLKPHPIYFVETQKCRFIIEMTEKKTRILDFFWLE